MARTEIYTISKKNKRIKFYKDVPRASLGAMTIWQTLEKEYLPTLPIDLEDLRMGITYHSRFFEIFNPEATKPIWALQKDPRLTWNERVLLATTMDGAYIKREDLLEVAKAYGALFKDNPNIQEQSKILIEIYNTFSADELFGVYILATSVCSIEDFAKVEYDKDTDNEYLYLPDDAYDCVEYIRDLNK